MHSLLENYLTEVATHLDSIPALRRNEELKEMRQHLWDSFKASHERGLTEEDAVAACLTQFGTPDETARNILRTWQRGEVLRKRDFWGAAACTVVLSFVLSGLGNYCVHTYGFRDFSSWEARIVFLASTYVGNVLTGGTSGLVFPRRAVTGTAFGITMSFLIAWALLLALGYLHGHSLLDHVNVPLLMLGQIPNILIAVLGAWTGSRWRKRRTQFADL